MNILKSINKKTSKEQIRESETDAAKELNEFINGLAERYDIVVVPKVVLGFDIVRGVSPVSATIDIVSNKRLKK